VGQVGRQDGLQLLHLVGQPVALQAHSIGVLRQASQLHATHMQHMQHMQRKKSTQLQGSGRNAKTGNNNKHKYQANIK
jgi:hypothetical protein